MTETCREMALLIQADLDHELAPAEAARVDLHVQDCSHCTEFQAQMQSLSGRLRRHAPYHAASPTLHAAIRARIAAARPTPPASGLVATLRRSRWSMPRWRQAGPFGAGFAVAAGLALAFVVPGSGGLQDAVVAGHIRALQPGHLLDVASSDQHAVKPWFDGRLDYAPPVKDLRADGFPLAGGRLDYLAGRPVAVLVYQRRQHVIDLFVWPNGSSIDRSQTADSRSGYNVLHWNQDGLVFWATSDLNSKELAAFVKLWQAG